MADTLLEARNLRAGYSPEVDIIQGCDVDIAEGELVSVIGPNGAGKTTLFNLVTGIYEITDPVVAHAFVAQLGLDLQDESCAEEVQSLGRTLRRWLDQITNWHLAGVSNGPTEAINNLIKRIKRIGFGFRRLRNYRIRALLYAGRPNWDLLATVEPR